MAEERDTLAIISEELGKAFLPLKQAISSVEAFKSFMAQLGWTVANIPTPIQGLLGVLNDLETALNPVLEGIATLEQYDTLRQELVNLFDAIQALEGASFDAGLVAESFATKFPKQLVQYLIITYLTSYQPRIAFILRALGIIRVTYVAAAGGRPGYMRMELVWDDLPNLFKDPVSILEQAYGWRTTSFNSNAVLQNVQDLMLALGIPSYLEEMDRKVVRYLENQVAASGDPIHRQLNIAYLEAQNASGAINIGLGLFPLPQDGALLPGLAVLPYVKGAIQQRFVVMPDLYFSIASGLNVQGGVGIILRPDQPIKVVVGLDDPASATSAEGMLRARLEYEKANAETIVLIGSRNGSRLELESLSLLGGLYLDATKQAELYVETELQGGKLVISAGSGDGFLQKILPKDGFGVRVDLVLGLSSQRGFYFRGSSNLEVTLPTHLEIGGIKIESLTIAANPLGDTLPINLGAAVKAQLGPILVTVENMGLTAEFSFPGSGGNLGPLGLSIRFKSPTGVGLVVDAGTVTGGGFLSIDTANGRYAGVLQLSIANTIAITAIGLLDTQLPGGVKGFSFLIIITAKFPPIQLGFGFALTGLGGLAGIHRSIVVKALQDGVRNKSIDNILFPENPVRDAPKLISDLQAIFPPTEGQFVFGPMAIITWGTPTVVEAELGIILELPNPIRLVILGQVNVTLPDKKVPVAVVDLHIDIVGIIDFTNRNLSIDASLHDSRLLAYNLYGDMALRLSWGNPPNFALSVGGLHPQFQPPPEFPTLRRLTVALGLGENPRISLQAYLAVTSNTVQFGALAELYAEAAGFNVYGWIGFDVLFIFTPFSLTADFSAGVALRKGSTIIASVHLAATLTGPTPWHAWGEASISILFLSVTVTFDATFGEEAQLVVEVADPWAALEAEIKKLGNWSATLPPAISQVVSLIAPGVDEPGLALIDPLGGLTLRQKAVPFDRTLTKFGQGNLAQTQRFTLGGVTVGTQPATNGSPLLDYFAPGQFEEMTNAEKLSRSSFEQMQAGTTIASDAVAFGTAKGTNYTYKTVVIDAPDAEPRPVELYELKANHQAASLQRSAAAQSPLQTTGLGKFAPSPSEPALVTLGEEEYIIVNTNSLSDQTEIILRRTLIPEWKPSVQHAVGDRILPRLANGHIYRCAVAGSTGGLEPDWPTAANSPVSDGTVTWQEFHDQALKTKGARNQLLVEYLVDHPEEMSKLEVMPAHEVMETV